MAAFAIPNFESHLGIDYMDSTQHNFASMDDFFGVDTLDLANNQNSRQGSSMPFAFNSVSEGMSGIPQSTAAMSNLMPISSDADNFAFPQRPHIWLDPSHSQKGGPNDMDADFALSSVTDSHVDYTFLAGENSSLLGVDPTMIQQHQNAINTFGNMSPFPIGPLPHQTQSHTLSPATSQNSSQLWTVSSHSHSQSGSPFSGQQMSTYPSQSPHPHHPTRQLSTHSISSRHSQGSPRFGSAEVDEEGKERTQCPFADCGKSFKDLKAHMLTHQNERPEKCPITACEYHKRGFARKYDRNRHLVTTHYKATIVCGFCPGSGSSAEKSFNRTDVFKRHLVTVHGVDQHPSNSKKRTPPHSARQSPALPEDATGKCSTCGQIFATPQELFDHFDDCVLRVVTQTDPAEEANEKNLRSVAEDSEVKATLDRHLLAGSSSPSSINGDTDEPSDEVDEIVPVSNKNGRSGKGAIGAPKAQATGSSLHTVTDGHITKSSTWAKPNSKGRAGVTYSKGGVSLQVAKGRKKKKYYPTSWGCPTDQMKLKKRVLTVFDGQRRLWKDDMMLGDDVEVRMKLPNAEGDAYITDLDVETLKRAEGFFSATEEERGPWIPSNYAGDYAAELFQEHQLQQMQQLQQQQQQDQQQMLLLPPHSRQQ